MHCPFITFNKLHLGCIFIFLIACNDAMLLALICHIYDTLSCTVFPSCLDHFTFSLSSSLFWSLCAFVSGFSDIRAVYRYLCLQYSYQVWIVCKHNVSNVVSFLRVLVVVQNLIFNQNKPEGMLITIILTFFYENFVNLYQKSDLKVELTHIKWINGIVLQDELCNANAFLHQCNLIRPCARVINAEHFHVA